MLLTQLSMQRSDLDFWCARRDSNPQPSDPYLFGNLLRAGLTGRSRCGGRLNWAAPGEAACGHQSGRAGLGVNPKQPPANGDAPAQGRRRSL
jgi:hypothetical protein